MSRLTTKLAHKGSARLNHSPFLARYLVATACWFGFTGGRSAANFNLALNLCWYDLIPELIALNESKPSLVALLAVRPFRGCDCFVVYMSMA